jgi:formylglycine-generating enzyme required for sulfatase activity
MKTTNTFFTLACCLAQAAFAGQPKPPGMVWIPGGEFSIRH